MCYNCFQISHIIYIVRSWSSEIFKYVSGDIKRNCTIQYKGLSIDNRLLNSLFRAKSLHDILTKHVLFSTPDLTSFVFFFIETNDHCQRAILPSWGLLVYLCSYFALLMTFTSTLIKIKRAEPQIRWRVLFSDVKIKLNHVEDHLRSHYKIAIKKVLNTQKAGHQYWTWTLY